MKNIIFDIRDFIYYDLMGNNLPEPPKIDFEQGFVLHKTKHGYWVESKKYPGLIASGQTLTELREALFDSILTYFDVPRPTAKKVADLFILKLANGEELRPKTPLLKSIWAKVVPA
jgi:hypothetical protein